MAQPPWVLVDRGRHYGELREDGAVHFQVAPDGSDGSGHGSASRPLRTVQAAVDRYCQWLELGLNMDAGIDLEAADYAEYVDIRLPRPPKRRGFLRGPADGTVVKSGTLTGASSVLLTDAAGSLGASQDQAGRIVKIYDEEDVPGTDQWKTIRSHTGTAAKPVEPFMLPPEVGWKYEVQKPSARITGNPDQAAERGYAPTLSVNLPWGGAGFPYAQGGGPLFMIADLQIEQLGLGGQNVMVIDGGAAMLCGVVLEGDGFAALSVARCALNLGQIAGGLYDDPLWGIDAIDYGTLYGKALGIRSSAPGGMVGLSVGVGAYVSGAYVFVGVSAGDFPIFVPFGYGAFFGGATHSGRNIWGEQGDGEVEGGLFDTDLPFLVRNCVGLGGIEGRYGANVIIGAVEFSEVTGSAIACSKGGGKVEIWGPLTKSGPVTGYCLDSQNGGMIAIEAAATGFEGDLGAGRADADTEATFAGIVAGSPLIGANSDSRIWRK